MSEIELIEAALRSSDPDVLVACHKYLSSPYVKFRPRPDDPEHLDQQHSFVFDQFDGLACLLGGNGAGKSIAAAYKVARFIRETPPPDRDTLFWVGCQKMDLAVGICWAQHLEGFLPEAKVLGWYNQARGWPSAVSYSHKNGHRWIIEFKSYEMGRAALQAAGIGGFWVDEQVDHSILTEIIARTRNYRLPGSQVYSLTPLRPDYELEQIFAEQEKWPRWKFYRLNSLCNKTISHDFLQQTLEEQRETRTVGAFASYSGSIYRSFGSQHVVDLPEIPRGWRKVGAIDFGWDHPTVALFGAVDLGGRFYIYDEYVQSQDSIEAHVAAIKAKWPGGIDYTDIWADHAAAQDRHEFAIRGLPTKPAHKDVLGGIAKVQEMLRPGDDGKPRLLISKKCENLIREMRTYVWNPNIPNKPLKRDDDAVDALRYLVFSDGRDLKPIPGLKVENRFFKAGLRAR